MMGYIKIQTISIQAQNVFIYIHTRGVVNSCLNGQSNSNKKKLFMLQNLYLSILERKKSQTAIVSDFPKQQATYHGVLACQILLACAASHLPHRTRKAVEFSVFFQSSYFRDRLNHRFSYLFLSTPLVLRRRITPLRQHIKNCSCCISLT